MADEREQLAAEYLAQAKKADRLARELRAHGITTGEALYLMQEPPSQYGRHLAEIQGVGHGEASKGGSTSG